MKSEQYPPSPEIRDFGFLKPTGSFRRSAGLVVLSVFLFVLCYFLLVALSLALLAGAVYLGLEILEFRIGFLSFVFAACVMMIGLMFFLFTVKFIFTRTREDNSDRVRISQEEYPELFEFIRSVAKDTKAPFPKKVYLSPDVNASVFYNSSFWSMLLPVGKNLNIGLGLINCLNLSEFKSVLAHEFGHFSQRSMTLGSYIYTVNRAIYNLVFTRDRLDQWLFDWSRAGGIVGFFGIITYWMVERIRGLLRLAYDLINVTYMKLSREMEYHADLVAVSVAGNTAFKSSLRKISFAGFAMEFSAVQLGFWGQESRGVKNIYPVHEAMGRYLKKLNKISGEGNFAVSEEAIERVVTPSRVIVRDQWASHPSLEEREKNIRRISIEAPVNDEPAWALLPDTSGLQQKMTQLMYGEGGVPENVGSTEEFIAFVEWEIDKTRISERYRGYYDQRLIHRFDPEVKQSPAFQHFDEIFSDRNIEMLKRQEENKADYDTLEMIHRGMIPTRTFEFDGMKYRRKKAMHFMKILKKEMDAAEEHISATDKQAFLYFAHGADEKDRKELSEMYARYFSFSLAVGALDEINMKFDEFIHKISENPFLDEQEVLTFAVSLRLVENKLKEFISSEIGLLGNAFLQGEERLELVKRYGHSKHYFGQSTSFDDKSIELTAQVVGELNENFGWELSVMLKEITAFQLVLEDRKQP